MTATAFTLINWKTSSTSSASAKPARSKRDQKRASEQSGRNAEDAVRDAMVSEGWVQIASRARTRWGEIDLIMRRGRTVAFVEVKASANADTLAQRIDPRCQHRVRRAAVAWISLNASALTGVTRFRFDAGLVTLEDGDICSIEMITNAF